MLLKFSTQGSLPNWFVNPHLQEIFFCPLLFFLEKFDEIKIRESGIEK